MASVLVPVLPAQADQFYDAGLKAFQGKKFAEAAAYFEQSIKAAPWESNAFYYCALAYHYKGDFKNAIDKYGQCVERFPGTQACNNAMDALKRIDPGYFKRRVDAVAKADAAGRASSGKQGGTTAAAEKDMGTVEGDAARVLFRLNGGDRVVDCFINGRSTRAIFDPNSESTSFSRQQLAALAITPPKGSIEMRCDVKIGGITRRNFPVTIDDGGMPAKIGTSFTDSFSVNVDDNAKSIDLRKKTSGGIGATSISFTTDNKSNIIVPVEVNGRSAQMILDPGGSGLSMDAIQAKGLGLKTDDAETQHRVPGEGPQRGEAGWVPDEDRAPQAKLLAVRLKLGPCVQNGVTCKINETSDAKYPTVGADFITGGGYKFDIDRRSRRLTLTRK